MTTFERFIVALALIVEAAAIIWLMAKNVDLKRQSEMWRGLYQASEQAREAEWHEDTIPDVKH